MNAGTEDSIDALPVGFDRQGGWIVFDENGIPEFLLAETVYPVLQFAGKNSDGSKTAYTSLARVSLGAEKNREPVSLSDAFDFTMDDLVPTGELVVETNGVAEMVSDPGSEFVVFSTWSPTDPDRLAYGYTYADKTGITVFDMAAGEVVWNLEEDLIPDYFAWDDDGTKLVFQLKIGEGFDTGVFEACEEDKPDYRGVTFDFQSDDLDYDQDSIALNGSIQLNSFGQGFEADFLDGSRLISSNLTGGGEVVFRGFDGQLSLIEVEQFRARSRQAVAYVNTEGSVMTLRILRGSDGKDIPVMSAASVTYYIPVSSSSTVSFTQVGASYSGGGCAVSSHTSGSSMCYAVDVQISGTSHDDAVASAAGTISSFLSSVSVNCGDASGCSDYNSAYTIASTVYSSCLLGKLACNSSSSSTGYGWGNYVILAHSDGYYTKTTHLEKTNFQVTTTGRSAVAGCWIADEGHTGNSCGNKGGCGDHLHFQKQSSSSRSGTSVSVSFYEDSSLTSSDCTTKTPVVGGSCCSL